MPRRLYVRYVEEGELKESWVTSGRLVSRHREWQVSQLADGLRLASSALGERAGHQIRYAVSSTNYHLVAPSREIEQFTVTLTLANDRLTSAVVRMNDRQTEVRGEFEVEPWTLPDRIDLARYGHAGAPGAPELRLGSVIGELDPETAEVVSGALDAIAGGHAISAPDTAEGTWAFFASSSAYRAEAGIEADSEDTAQFRVEVRAGLESVDVRVTDRDDDSVYAASFARGHVPVPPGTAVSSGA